MALLITNDDVKHVLTMAQCLQSVEEGLKEYYAGDAACKPRVDVWAPAGDPRGYYHWGSMEGTSRRYRILASRMMSDVFYWVAGEKGLRTQEKYSGEPGKYCGLILLFSTDNGEPLAIVHDGYIQQMRVGATAGLAARYLALQDASILGVIGSGGMARAHAMAFCEVRKIKRVQVYSPNVVHRKAYAKEMSDKLTTEVEPVGSPRLAVRRATIVSTCTDSVVPVLKPEWLEEGTFLSTVNTAEAGEDVFRRVDVFVGFSVNSTVERPSTHEQMTPAHRISNAYQAYVAGRPEELARIPEIKKFPRRDQNKVIPFKEVFEGRSRGRRTQKEIISLAGNQIQGVQFASVAGLTHQLVRARGLGREFPTDWLLQDIRN